MTCICPTSKTRAKYWPVAVEAFRRQTYAHRELLLVFDEHPGEFPTGEGIRCAVIEKAHSLGAKRNACVELARPGLIAHWDDDDWSHPERLSTQIEQLRGRAVTGFADLWFHDLPTDAAWLYRGTSATGTSLLYRRDWALANPFRQIDVGEDSTFASKAAATGQLSLESGLGLMVATSHASNTSPRRYASAQWTAAKLENFPESYVSLVLHPVR